jgi:hypothetical protein
LIEPEQPAVARAIARSFCVYVRMEKKLDFAGRTHKSTAQVTQRIP